MDTGHLFGVQQMSRPLRFDTIKNRFFKPRFDVTIGTQLGALALVCSPPFVFFLFGLVKQTINLNWNTLALLFVPLVRARPGKKHSKELVPALFLETRRLEAETPLNARPPPV